MTSDDKFHVFERLSALYEIFGKTVTGRTLETYWKALINMPLERFDSALDRAAAELKRPPSPAELRELSRDSRRVDESHKEREYLCHFHGDGQFERCERGRPDEPSTNRTVWWCPRCTHFVKLGKQRPDLAPLPGAPLLVRQLADSKSTEEA